MSAMPVLMLSRLTMTVVSSVVFSLLFLDRKVYTASISDNAEMIIGT